MEKLSTDILKSSLLEGEHCLKTRADGTILEGHHRDLHLAPTGRRCGQSPRDVIEKK